MNRQIKTTWKQKVLLVTGSLALLFVLLETLARISGSLYSYYQHRGGKKVLNEENEYRIMALGESTTAIGFGHSWPQTLERHLNQENFGKNFVVINEGVSGTDTQKILETLEHKISMYRPHMIITMMGINDYWNLIKNNQLTEKWSPLWDQFKVLKFFKLFIINMQNKDRVENAYLAELDRVKEDKRLEQELNLALEKDPQSPELHLRLGEFYTNRKNWSLAKRAYEKAFALGASTDGPNTLHHLGYIHLNLNDKAKAKEYYDQALAREASAEAYSEVASMIFYDNHLMNLDLVTHYMGKALQMNPSKELQVHIYRILIEIYTLSPHYQSLELARKYFQALRSIPYYDIDAYLRFSKLTVRKRNYKESIDVLEEGKDKITHINPTIHFMGKDEIWQQLILSYDLAGQTEMAQKRLTQASEIFPGKQWRRATDKEGYHAFLETKWEPKPTGKDIYSEPITRENYLRAIRTIKDHGILPVAMQYPNRDAEPLRRMLNSEKDMIIIDHNQTFKEALKTHKFEDLFVDHFGGDTGHFNVLGSELMAKEIVRTFKEKNLFKTFKASLN